MKKGYIALFLSILLVSLFFINCEETITPGTPTGLTLIGTEDGLKVKLTWTAPTEAVDGYYIYFKPTGSDTWSKITVTTTTYTHNPSNKTGDYKVSAYKGNEESPTTSIKTTKPKETQNLTLNELNATGESGLMFTLSDGSASTYSMTATDAANKVDFYLTDLAAGSGGSTYYIASGDIVTTTNEGGFFSGIPTSGWRVNGILQNPFDDATNKVMKAGKDWLPTTSPYAAWQSFADNGTYGVVINYDGSTLTGNYYYGYITVGSRSGTQITISKAYFQTVPNLRLLFN